MQPPAPRRRSAVTLALLGVLAALAFAGLVALGAWQVERLGWKEGLIARIERQLQEPPHPAPGPAQWPALTREADEYRRVQVAGHFDDARQVLVRASTELGGGYWVLTPLRTDSGWWLLVNRGFIPPEQQGSVPPAGRVAGLAGLLRLSEPGGSLLQKNDPAQGRWYSRDVAAIAAARGLEGPVAPYFVDLQATPEAGPGSWPRPGLTVLRFSNNHLMYAITWFSLAAMVAAGFGYLVMDERRLRRAGAAGRGDR